MPYQPATVERDAYHELNALVADSYEPVSPELAAIVRDPRAFLADFQARVADRPEDPLNVPFGDHGLPVVKALLRSLDEERVVLQHELARVRTNPFAWRRQRWMEDLEVGLQLIAALKAELQGHLDRAEIGYLRLLELSYQASRVVGHFDWFQLSWIEKLILTSDRLQQGFDATTIQEEKRRYEARNFPLFQRKTIVDAFERSRETFLRDFEAGRLVGVPTCAALDEDILLRLLPFPIYLGGVSAAILGTDGYSRTSGDLSLHDVQHSTLIYASRRAYEAMHDLGPEAIERLEWLMDRWALDLLRAWRELEARDPEDARAVRFYLFNHHHDQGNVLVPSSIQRGEMEPVGWLLYFKMTLTKQMPPLTLPKARFARAHAFLVAFWAPRRAEEEALWGPKAGHVPWATSRFQGFLATLVKLFWLR